MKFAGLSKDAFKRIVSDPKKYGIEIRPIRDCVTKSPKWRSMSGIIVRIHHEYKESIPIPILSEIFFDIFSDLAILNDKGDVVCKLSYRKPQQRNIFGGFEKII